MGARKYKPATPNRHGASVSDFVEITCSKPEELLLHPLHKIGGRNSNGRVTVRYCGGGHRRQYQVIDFRCHDKDGVPAVVAHIEYDPNRTARIALLYYADDRKCYILVPAKPSQGDRIRAGIGADIKPGNNLPLRNIPLGTVVYAVEFKPGGGARITHSTGSSTRLAAKEGRFTQLRIPSDEIYNAKITCRTTVSGVDNAEQSNISWGKAGHMCRKDKRPHVRGVTMNPANHPCDGGEDHTSGGCHPVSPQGKPEGRIRRPNRDSDHLIVRHHKTGENR